MMERSDGDKMERSLSDRERSHRRFVIDLPLEYQKTHDSCLRGGAVINVSEGGLLIETVRDIPVGTELNVAIPFPNGFELTTFKVMAKIVRKEPYRKEDWRRSQYWEGYQYGLEFIQILEEDSEN